MNLNMAAFSLLKISDFFFGLAFELKDLIGNIIKNFPSIGENHLLAKTVEKFYTIGGLKLLDLFCYSGLCDAQGLRCCGEASVFDDKVKDF